jgi:hypothetical protein
MASSLLAPILRSHMNSICRSSRSSETYTNNQKSLDSILRKLNANSIKDEYKFGNKIN